MGGGSSDLFGRAKFPLLTIKLRTQPDCESAPKWDPFSSPGKYLISARKFVRGGVQVGADRDPGWWRAFSVRSATYAEISRGPTLVLIHTAALQWPAARCWLPTPRQYQIGQAAPNRPAITVITRTHRGMLRSRDPFNGLMRRRRFRGRSACSRFWHTIVPSGLRIARLLSVPHY
jgi:hypothetical protein